MKKRFIRPIVEVIKSTLGRGNNTCTSSGSGNANVCTANGKQGG